MTHEHTPDDLTAELDRLSASQRRAVIAALQHSKDSGWPASETAARLLIAYAAGHIDAREYARQILVSLGAAPATVSTPEPERLEPRTPAAPPPTTPPSFATPLMQPLEPQVPTAEARRITREEAVQAYVSGRIPVAEFLRIARGA